MNTHSFFTLYFYGQGPFVKNFHTIEYPVFLLDCLCHLVWNHCHFMITVWYRCVSSPCAELNMSRVGAGVSLEHCRFFIGHSVVVGSGLKPCMALKKTGSTHFPSISQWPHHHQTFKLFNSWSSFQGVFLQGYFRNLCKKIGLFKCCCYQCL